MVKTLRQIGNSYGIIIDRPIMELLKIAPETRLEMTVHNDGLLLQPIRDTSGHKNRVRESAARMSKIHRKSLKELAD
jgi:antitoxin MazE